MTFPANRKISRGILRIIALLFSAVLFFGACEKIKYTQYSFTSLEFPIENPDDIERIAGYGIPDWSGTEPHNGIDLIIYEHLSGTTIISPVKGTIREIKVSENPFSNPVGQLILSVEIYVNSHYSLFLVVEPGTANSDTKSYQLDALQVEENQIVTKGEVIGELLVGELGYPHLHFMMYKDDECVCAYSYASSAAKQIFDEIIAERENNSFFNGNVCGEL